MSDSHFNNWFSKVDEDGSGSIDMVEIVGFLKEITEKKDESSLFVSKFPTGKRTQQTQLKQRGKGIFQRLIKLNKIPSKTDVLHAVSAYWNIYDADGNGVLDRDEAKIMISDII